MKGVLALAVVSLMMVSSVAGFGYSYCTCEVDGNLVAGTIVTSPDGSASYCSCPGSQQPPSHHHGNKHSPSHHHGHKHSPSHHHSKNPPPQNPKFQLPPIPFFDPRAQTCLQEFVNSNLCMSQVDEAYRYQNLALVQPYCCKQFKGLSRDCSSTIFTYLNLPFFESVVYDYCNQKV